MYFSVKVKVLAIQKVWILGDTFLQKIYHSYDTLRDRARRSRGKMETPYLLDAYTVSSHVMEELNGIHSPAARIQNCLIHKLDTCKNMPRFIVVIADNDIIKAKKEDFYNFGAMKMSQEITGWMVNEFNDQIKLWKKELREICLGAVLPGEPKVVYVKMIYCPRKDEIQAERNHFNTALENNLCGINNHYIMDIEVHGSMFDHTNCLTEQGQIEFWRVFDSNMRKLDEKINSKFMMPQHQEMSSKKHDNKLIDTNQYRLPPPPPQARKKLSFVTNKKIKPMDTHVKRN